MTLHETGDFRGPSDVAIEDGLISAVGPDLPLSSAPSYDLSGSWLLPGMFDCHLHASATSIDTVELLQTPLSQRVLEAGSILSRTLRAGVTFARDAGGSDVGIKRAIERGYAEGPHLQLAVSFLCETGGHFDGFLPGPSMDMVANYQVPDYAGRPPFLVDGIDEMRKAVRQLLRAGADWIKLATTGGIMSPHDQGSAPQFTEDEILVAVGEAHRKGKGVMAHCFGGEGLYTSVRAGVTSIEHGTLLDEQGAQLMTTRHCWLVPTLSALWDVVGWADEGRLAPASTRKAQELKPKIGDAVRIARDSGVKIALGTDLISREQHGKNLREIAYVVDAGLSIEDALRAATLSGAELCGVADRYGRIAAGYVFDAFVLDEDPSDLAFARNGTVAGVFKAGHPVVKHPRMSNRVT
jgi:imidazolonepropionase-like amidohydrolase